MAGSRTRAFPERLVSELGAGKQAEQFSDGARFFNEARAANIIDHAGIVKVIDYGHLPSGEAYLAMEYLEGESLFQRLSRERRLSEVDTLRLGRQIAAALAAAHAKQIIHRDLKPENVFIVPDVEATGGERAKILDFGIAKLTREHQGLVLTQTNALMGTPIYMSPEQCRGKKDITDRTDVYALGTMLYELLAGRPPFIAEDPGEYIPLHMYQMPAPLSQLAPYVAPALHRLIDSMLAKEPTVRPSMAAVARVLKELGNLSSDVISVPALAEVNDTETQPIIRVGQLAKPGGLAPPAPISALKGLPGVGPAPPSPSSVERLAAGDRAPPSEAVDRTDRMPAHALPSRPISALDAPARYDPLPARAASSSVAASQDSTRQLDRTAMPTPAGQVGEAGWQRVAVMPGSSAVSLKLDADSAIVDPRNAHRRAKSIGHRLRRLRFKLKKRVYTWLGIPIHDRRNTPPATTIARRALLIGGGGVAVLGLLIFFALRSPAHTAMPLPSPGPVNLETPQPLETPPRPPPMTPAPPQPLPEGLATALSRAREKAFVRDMYSALRIASSAAKTYKHPLAWRAVGEYACQSRKANKANDARTALLEEGSQEAKLLLKQMLEICRHNFVIEQGDKLILSSEAR